MSQPRNECSLISLFLQEAQLSAIDLQTRLKVSRTLYCLVARVWWPCNDRPDDKAIVDVTVTAPSEYTVASNGLMESTVDHGDGTTTTRWASVYSIASYLVVMNAADYVHSEETYVSAQGTTMPVALYAFPEVSDQAEDGGALTSSC